MSFLLEISRILVLLLFCTVNSVAQSNNSSTSSTCSSSSCGNISTIRYPFRLKGNPISCGYNHPYFELDCKNNQTLLTVSSRNYHVHDINYEIFSIRLADSSINRANLSSCPGHSDGYNEWSSTRGRVRIFDRFFEFDKNHPVVFIHCVAPVSSSMYVNASFCGNRRSVFSNSSGIYSYVMAGDVRMSDLEDWCTVDRMQASARWPMTNTSSLASIYDDLAYRFELSWHRSLCEECERVHGFCRLEGNKLSCSRACIVDIPFSIFDSLSYWCQEDKYVDAS